MIEKYLNLTPEAEAKIETLYRVVLDSPVNVTAIKSREDFYIKHILDSLYYFTQHPFNAETLVDIGSGGGFPGIPLAVCYPKCRITLVDSIGKKCRFLQDMVKELELGNVSVINSRAENIKGDKFDLITARGVAPVKEVLNYTVHLANSNTGWLMYKGEKVYAELKEAEILLRKRGLKSEITRIETPFTRSYLYLSH